MSGMVVCAEPLGAQAGLSILRKGGNAVDAAIAAGFAEGASNPIMSGIGGSGTMVLHLAGTNEQVALDFWGVCGSGGNLGALAERYLGQDGACTRYHVRDRLNLVGHTASLVPGFVRGTHTAWQRFGSGKLVASIPVNIAYATGFMDAARERDQKWISRFLNNVDNRLFRRFRGKI